MKFKIFGATVSASVLALAVAVSALTFAGVVFAELAIANNTDFGGLKIGETSSLTIAEPNNTIDPYNLNFTTVCNDPSIVTAAINYFSGGVLKTKPLNLGGNTPIELQIDPLPINLTLTGQHQGAFNCTMIPVVSNSTNVTFVVGFPR